MADVRCYVDINAYTATEEVWFAPETFQVGAYTYVGYESLEALKQSKVTDRVNDYEYTSSIQE